MKICSFTVPRQHRRQTVGALRWLRSHVPAADDLEKCLSFLWKGMLRYKWTITSAVVVFGLVDAWIFDIFITWGDPTFAHLLAGIVAVASLLFFYRRLENQDEQTRIQTQTLKNQERQTELQIRKEMDDRFHAAVTLLGSTESAARTGALYSLYHLALESEKYREQVGKSSAVESEKYRKQAVEFICAYIRSKTEEEEYRKQHPTRPSNEIQTAINLLFGRAKELRGLYAMFPNVLPQADLSYAYLVGADFSYVNCQKISFWRANCQKAKFLHAYCYGAFFANAHCQGANFMHAWCQGADFSHACCQGAYFECANFQGADFSLALCQGAIYKKTFFHGAYAISSPEDISLSDRIDRNTELDTMVVLGEFSADEIHAINSLMAFMPDNWCEHMQRTIKENEGRAAAYAASYLPAGMIPGELENSPDLQKIIKEIEEED